MKPILKSLLAVLMAGSVGGVAEADNASPASKSFIATFSQPVMFEVALGQLAVTEGSTRSFRFEGTREAREHSVIVNQMKAVAASDDIAFPSTLNGDLLSELDHAKALHGKAFDAIFISDMISIHNADRVPFAKEAAEGNDTDLQLVADYEWRTIRGDLDRLQTLSKS